MPQRQRSMGNLAQAIIASEPAYQIDRSLRASALYARVSAISGFTFTETPTAVRPRHQPSLGRARSKSTATRMLIAAPAPRQPQSSHDAQDRM